MRGEQHAGAGIGHVGEGEDGGFRMGGCHDRRHLHDDVVQARHFVAPGEDRVDDGLEPARAPDRDDHREDDPRHPGHQDLGGSRRCGHRRPWWATLAPPSAVTKPMRGVVAAQCRRGPDRGRAPELQEQDQGAHGDEGGTDIDDPRVDVVRDAELGQRERSRRRPGWRARSGPCRGSPRTPRSARTAPAPRRTAAGDRSWRRGCRDHSRSPRRGPGSGAPRAP